MYRKIGPTLTWYILAAGVAFLFLVPLLSALTVSLTPKSDLITAGGRLFPANPTFENFAQVWHQVPFFKWYVNSTIISVLFTVGQLISISLTAFALARLRFPGRGLLMIVVLATMMMPFQAVMIPMFTLMYDLGWINTSLPLWVPAFFGDTTGAFGIFLLRQAFLGVPNAFAEAAVIEGASLWTIFWKVYLPLVKPFIAVVAVFSFMHSWNDFIRPIIYLTDREAMTVTGGLTFFRSDWHVEWGAMMGGALLSLLPTLVLYLFAQRYFVESAMSSGVKG